LLARNSVATATCANLCINVNNNIISTVRHVGRMLKEVAIWCLGAYEAVLWYVACGLVARVKILMTKLLPVRGDTP
jgi:ABC-type protease/lipase transport system fused ATPase/permease subunit